jgi:hypothetical protein
MAEPKWIFLFQKRLHSLELESLQFISPKLLEVPEGFLPRFENICVVFKGHRYNGCDLTYSENHSEFVFKLWLTEEFEHPERVKLIEDGQLSLYFRRVNNVVELMLDQGVTPEIPVEHYRDWTSFAYKERILKQDLENAVLSLSSHKIESFFEKSPLHVTQLIEEEVWFDLEAYSPGEVDSFDSQMRVKKGASGNLKDSTLLIDIRKATPDTLNQWEWVEVFFRYKMGKLEARFVTPRYPNHPNFFCTD